MPVLVAGASLGGLRAAEALRAAGFTGRIAVAGAEEHLPYNRPPLTKEALAGGVDVDALLFRRRRSVDDVEWRLGCTVASVDVDARTARLAGVDGAESAELAWDGLVIATGLRSRRLTADVSAGLPQHGAGRHAVRTAGDAAALRADLGPGRRLVVLGAGFIGCEVAATAIGLGCEVSVVAPEDVPMQRPLGRVVGAALQRKHEAHGVRFALGRLPAALEAAGGRVAGVVLDDGRRLAADVVVEALGSLPNVEWLADNGFDLADGVRCDAWMRATAGGRPRPDVVAVGDVARFPNALYDDLPRRVEHWNIPTETAKRAAPALAAGLSGAEPAGEPSPVMPAFWSDQHGLRLQSFGALDLADDVQVLEGDLGAEFVAGYLRNGALVGVAGIGLMPRLLALRGELLAVRVSRPA